VAADGGLGRAADTTHREWRRRILAAQDITDVLLDDKE
jgi:hypothetical protein